MHRHLRGGQAKDQPASAQVDEGKTRHIAKERSIQFRLFTVQGHMRTHDHGINLITDDVSCHKKIGGAAAPPSRPRNKVTVVPRNSLHEILRPSPDRASPARLSVPRELPEPAAQSRGLDAPDYNSGSSGLPNRREPGKPTAESRIPSRTGCRKFHRPE